MTNDVDPEGKRFYEEVLRKDIFDEKNPPPLVGLRVLTVNHLFAKVWSKSEAPLGQTVSLRERRLVTIALLAAQGHMDQLSDHVRGACLAGLTEEELLELMIHVAHYAGWAAGTSGQRQIREVFKSVREAKQSSLSALDGNGDIAP
jgi:alkylhydroperoxidase/carboxymuconolactone decarboxylase family protein YurZ